MKKLAKLVNFLLIISIFSINYQVLAKDLDPGKIEKIKNAIVSINSRISMSAYADSGSWIGTGFITDKTKGYIVTNTHVVGRAAVGTYLITFHNGQQAEARTVYYDVWQDYAILKIEPAFLPPSAEQIVFSNKPVSEGQDVFVIGATEAQDFSFHKGYISNFYEISGQMPQGSYIINLNSAGGVSGSPLLNDNSEAVGVVYGGGKTYALALKSSYVQSTLDSLKKDVQPTRKHIGVITTLYSLNKAAQHRNFPKKIMDEYLQKYPAARGRVVAIQNIIAGSPATALLQAGDIIWEAQGRPIGADLTIFDQAMNESGDSIKLVVYRGEERLELEVKLYDINSNKIGRMISFAGATFFEADDFTSAKSGVPLKSLTVKNVDIGSSFSTIPVNYMRDYKSFYIMAIKAFNQQNIANLDELAKIIPGLLPQKFINVSFKNYQPYIQPFDEIMISAHSDFIADITLDSIDNKPRILKYDYKTLEWMAEDIKE